MGIKQEIMQASYRMIGYAPKSKVPGLSIDAAERDISFNSVMFDLRFGTVPF